MKTICLLLLVLFICISNTVAQSSQGGLQSQEELLSSDYNGKFYLKFNYPQKWDFTFNYENQEWSSLLLKGSDQEEVKILIYKEKRAKAEQKQAIDAAIKEFVNNTKKYAKSNGSKAKPYTSTASNNNTLGATELHYTVKSAEVISQIFSVNLETGSNAISSLETFAVIRITSTKQRLEAVNAAWKIISDSLKLTFVEKPENDPLPEATSPRPITTQPKIKPPTIKPPTIKPPTD